MCDTKANIEEIREQLNDAKLSDGDYVILIHKDVYTRGRFVVAAFQNFKAFEENVQRITDEIIANDPDDGIYIEWITYE